MMKVIYNERLVGILAMLVVTSLCLVPYLPVYSIYIRLEDIILPFVIFLIWPYLKLFKHWYFLTLIIWAIIGIISMAYNHRLQFFNDYTEIYKLLKYSCFVILFYVFFKSNRRIFNPISILFIVLVIFNLVHYFNLFHFNEIVMPSYTTNINQLIFFGKNSLGGPATKRMLGTMGNPNINSILFLAFNIYFMFFLKIKEWHWGKLFFYFSLAMILMTQSRTGMFAFCIVFIIFLIIHKINWIRVLIPFLFIGITILVVNITDQYALKYVSYLNMNVEANGSLRGRLEVWTYLLGMISHKPLLGYGINKNYFYQNTLYSENEFILMFWRYGVFGLLTYLIMLLGLIVFYFKKVDFLKSGRSLFYLQMVIIFFISAITNTPLSDQVLFIVFALGTGAFLSQFDLKDEKIKKQI